MKRNFLITTSLPDTWEFNENNFILGKWCEFYEFDIFDNKKIKHILPKGIKIIKNKFHWDDLKKRSKDYEYLKEKLEDLLRVISENLSIIHNVKEDKEYWRVIIYKWLSAYTAVLFDRWEHLRIFFEENKDGKFYSNYMSLNETNYIPKNHFNFVSLTQSDEWNHIIYLRLFNFLNIKNLSIIKKEAKLNYMKNDSLNLDQLFTKSAGIGEGFFFHSMKLVDKILSKLAFNFNKIIFDTFHFPKSEYLKICLRCKLIPARFLNFFDFEIKEKSLIKENKRVQFKNLLSNVNVNDKFIKFLLINLHNDIPKSYLEDFKIIKEKILPLASKKKIIFSMHSIFYNDNFKIYIAETKKVGSKYIHSSHGIGLTNFVPLNPYFDFFKKVPDKMIRWDKTVEKNIFVNLSPTLPVVKSRQKKKNNYCSIIFYEQPIYIHNFIGGAGLEESIKYFNELTKFVDNLNPEIKSKIKFRLKHHCGYNSEKKFSEIFGEKSIDKISIKNPFTRTISNSKLIIVTTPLTAFAEAIYSNTPTILIIKNNFFQFSKEGLNIVNILKENKIIFNDFNEAKNHINKSWKELDLWWSSEHVQSARKMFLKDFFDIKTNWYKEWSDYIYFSLTSYKM